MSTQRIRACALTSWNSRARPDEFEQRRAGTTRFREVMNLRSDEPELRALMLAGLDGDAAAHKSLLARLAAESRAYFKGRLARIGRGAADAEDLVQETLIALHIGHLRSRRCQLISTFY